MSSNSSSNSSISISGLLKAREYRGLRGHKAISLCLERRFDGLEDPVVSKSDVFQGSILLRGRPFESNPSTSTSTDIERLTHNNSSLINISHNKTNVVSTIAVAISPDGQTVASSNGDHFVKVFDFHSGIQIRNFEGHPRTPWSLKYNPQNPDIIASGCIGMQARIWSISRNCCLNMIAMRGVISSIAFSPDGGVLAVTHNPVSVATSPDNFAGIFFWDYSESEVKCKTRIDNLAVERYSYSQIKHDRSIKAVVFHPNGDNLYAIAAQASKATLRVFKVNLSSIRSPISVNSNSNRSSSSSSTSNSSGSAIAGNLSDKFRQAASSSSNTSIGASYQSYFTPRSGYNSYMSNPAATATATAAAAIHRPTSSSSSSSSSSRVGGNQGGVAPFPVPVTSSVSSQPASSAITTVLLDTFAPLIDNIQLYSDGGLDVSADGKYLVTFSCECRQSAKCVDIDREEDIESFPATDERKHRNDPPVEEDLDTPGVDMENSHSENNGENVNKITKYFSKAEGSGLTPELMKLGMSSSGNSSNNNSSSSNSNNNSSSNSSGLTINSSSYDGDHLMMLRRPSVDTASDDKDNILFLPSLHAAQQLKSSSLNSSSSPGGRSARSSFDSSSSMSQGQGQGHSRLDSKDGGRSSLGRAVGPISGSLSPSYSSRSRRSSSSSSGTELDFTIPTQAHTMDSCQAPHFVIPETAARELVDMSIIPLSLRINRSILSKVKPPTSTIIESDSFLDRNSFGGPESLAMDSSSSGGSSNGGTSSRSLITRTPISKSQSLKPPLPPVTSESSSDVSNAAPEAEKLGYGLVVYELFDEICENRSKSEGFSLNSSPTHSQKDEGGGGGGVDWVDIMSVSDELENKVKVSSNSNSNPLGGDGGEDGGGSNYIKKSPPVRGDYAKILLEIPFSDDLTKSCTSVRFSSTTSRVCLSYGVHNWSQREDGHRYPEAAVELLDISKYPVVSRFVFSDVVDELNIAQLHPVAGLAIVYGTKKGVLRSLKTAHSFHR